MTQSIVFAGTPANAGKTLRELVAAGIEVALVITRPDAPTGRKAVLTPSPVADTAMELGIAVHKSLSIDAETISAIRATSAEVGVIVAFGSILKPEALEALPLGWFNLHYSLLPQLRGAAPVQHAIIRGLPETGVTLFRLDQGVDTGDFVSQVQTKIEPRETAARLLDRLTSLGTSLLIQDLPAIFAGTSASRPQAGQPSSAPKIDRAMARIDFSRTARELEGLVLGCNPEPGAWAVDGANPIKIHDAFAFEVKQDFVPGTVFMHGNHVAVACAGNTALALREVQPAGKQRMSASDWFRGKSNEVRLS